MTKAMHYTEKNLLKHLLSLEHLTKQTILNILDTAETFFDQTQHEIIKKNLFPNKIMTNLFFESSTRTRATFEIAAKNLGVTVLNLDIAHSSTNKGESLLDTIDTMAAMETDIFVIRHPSVGAADFIVKNNHFDCSIINAGDGAHAHPTQGLLDLFTIRKEKGGFNNLCVTVIGDIKHSRVARSLINGLQILGVGEIRVVGPPTLIPTSLCNMGVHIYQSMKDAIRDSDVIMALRLQKERMNDALIASESEFHKHYGLHDENLSYCKQDVLIMHPGPMNRGVEIASNIADSKNSVILKQVRNGIAIRMAIISILLKKDS